MLTVSADVYIWPPESRADSFDPSADEAMDFQFLTESRAVQDDPESADV
jgi:hypothetical protein